MDSATLQATFDDPAIPVSTLRDLGDCRYSTLNDNQHDVLMSKSGIQVVLSMRTDATSPVFGKTDLSFDIPLQTVPLADLAGTWNAVEHFRDPINGKPLLEPMRWTLTMDTVGGATICDPDGTCFQSRPEEAVRADPAGGFLIGAEDPVEGPSRVFAVRNAEGQLSMFWSYSNRRGIVVLGKQAPLALPSVGTSARYWDFSVGSDGWGVAPVADVTTTVVAVDTAAGSFRRSRASDGRIDTFTLNQPQAGLRSRAVNDCVAASGAAIGCVGVVAMPLPGTGITVYTTAAPSGLFGVSVERP